MMNSANPYLPTISVHLGAAHTRQHRAECGEKFYLAALELAQSHWLSKKPAQALLQLNKAFMANLADDAAILNVHPLPYRALVWFLENRPIDHFIGNPVRHFQHLATRISGPRPELRSQRSWACFQLAIKILPAAKFPFDEFQIARENIKISSIPEILNFFESHRPQEAATIKNCLRIVADSSQD